MAEPDSEDFLLVKFVNFCESQVNLSSDSYLNETGLQNDKSISNSMGFLKLITELALSLINIILNFISYLVFVKWKKRPINKILIFLSISEIFFNFSWWSEFIFKTLPNIRDVLKIYSVIYLLADISGNGCLIMRNWALVLIAFARFEVVKYPLKPKKICEGNSLKLILLIILTISLIYGCIRIFEYNIIICANNNEITLVNSLLMLNKYYTQIFLNAGFLLLQGFGPVISVFILSIALIYQMHRSSHQSDTQIAAAIFRKYRGSSSKSIRSRNRASDEFKNGTILCLCGVFFLMETPQCIIYTLYSIELIDPNAVEIIVQGTRMLLLFDSVSNFWIYIASNKKFRMSLRAILLCANFRNSRDRSTTIKRTRTSSRVPSD